MLPQRPCKQHYRARGKASLSCLISDSILKGLLLPIFISTIPWIALNSIHGKLGWSMCKVHPTSVGCTPPLDTACVFSALQHHQRVVCSIGLGWRLCCFWQVLHMIFFIFLFNWLTANLVATSASTRMNPATPYMALLSHTPAPLKAIYRDAAMGKVEAVVPHKTSNKTGTTVSQSWVSTYCFWLASDFGTALSLE